MSEENVELVRRGYEHFAQTGEADLSVYSPDVEWHNTAEDPFAEPFHGVEGVRRLIQEVRESLDDFRTDPRRPQACDPPYPRRYWAGNVRGDRGTGDAGDGGAFPPGSPASARSD